MKATSNGQLVAEAADADIVSIEGNNYFPPTSLVEGVLVPSATQSTCPWKGRAQYWDIVTPTGVVKDGAWSYPAPAASAKAKVGHDFSGFVAFAQH